MQTDVTERFIIRGDLAAPGFPQWIARHAGRLGLRALPEAREENRLALIVGGPPDLVDAMELGCSLGPHDVWVETIERESLLPAD